MPSGRRREVSRHQAAGELRIIGGRWRGRRLPVVNAQGLRPTADRVRETLFNWLVADITGARCLDLFAGSGALGIEALSRGAAHCTFVDNNSQTLKRLVATLENLDAADRAICHAKAASTFVDDCERPYDLVFVDPPFADNLLEDICLELQASRALSDDSLVYLESGLAITPDRVPRQWQALRQKRAGAVHYALYRCSTDA